MKERKTGTLNIVSANDGTCGICRKLPVAEKLTVEAIQDGEQVKFVLCRHCMAEYAPELLAAVEAE